MESEIASGNARLVFNLMLVFMSPVTGIISGKFPVRTILIYVTLIRSFIWCTFVPFLYVAGKYLKYLTTGRIIGNLQFYLLIAFDGALISILNAVDLDCGGLSILSSQYGLEITPIQKSQAIYTHLTVFDITFIFLNPLLALVTLLLVPLFNSVETGKASLDPTLSGDNSFTLENSGIEVPLLVAISVFQAFSTISIFFYKFGIPESTELEAKDNNQELEDYYVSISQERAQKVFENDEKLASPSQALGLREIKDKISSFFQGLMLIKEDKHIRNRIFCLAFETALEDVMISVIIPLTIIHISKDLLQRHIFKGQNSCVYWSSSSLIIVSLTLGFGKLSSFITTWKYKKDSMSNRNFEINATTEFECNFHPSEQSISSESIPSSNGFSITKSIQELLSEDNFSKIFLQISFADLTVAILPVSYSIATTYPEIIEVQIACKLSTLLHVFHADV
ncbi:putative transmembrane protein [Cryptosporidium felis]|nr:putative transmembrane protein [Cryptosporidium felis]